MPDGAFAIFLVRVRVCAAVAPHRSKHIARQALRVDAHERRRLAVQIAAHQRDPLILRPDPFETMNRELPVARGQFGLRHIVQPRSPAFGFGFRQGFPW